MYHLAVCVLWAAVLRSVPKHCHSTRHPHLHPPPMNRCSMVLQISLAALNDSLQTLMSLWLACGEVSDLLQAPGNPVDCFPPFHNTMTKTPYLRFYDNVAPGSFDLQKSYYDGKWRFKCHGWWEICKCDISDNLDLICAITNLNYQARLGVAGILAHVPKILEICFYWL